MANRAKSPVLGEAVVLGLCLVGLFGLTVWTAGESQRDATRSQALAHAVQFTDVVGEFRTIYTEHVVQPIQRSQGAGITVSHDFEGRPGAIPLPATLSMELGRRMGRDGAGVKLYSPYPFPWREEDGGLKDEFSRDAWEALSREPEMPFYRYEIAGANTVLRYAVADRLRPACVNCHNTHPDTPRSGWSSGDVRGVLEARIPVDATSAESSAFWQLIAPGFVLAAILVVFIVIRLRRTTRTLENEVDRRTVELAERMRRYQLLFDTSPAGIVVLGKSGPFRYWNPAFEHMFGYGPEQLASMNVSDLTHEDDRGRGSEVMEQLTADPDETAQVEKRYVRKDGEVLWARTHVRVLHHEDGEVVEMFAMVNDISDQRRAQEVLEHHRDQLEREVKARTLALQASNQELESFCYSVSHDLRAPLRGIDGFSQALLEDYSDQLDEDGKDYLARVRAGTKRMATLIDELLELSRVGRADMDRKMLDVSGMAESLVQELRDGEPEREVSVTIQPNITAWADGRLLGLVLQNLIGNAWKFTGERAQAAIDVFTEEGEGREMICVKDNGAGFDMEFSDQLFAPFKRLHSSTEFPGSGVGLATVQRILHRHGGQVEAHAIPGQGAEFRFWVPPPDTSESHAQGEEKGHA